VQKKHLKKALLAHVQIIMTFKLSYLMTLVIKGHF